MPELLARLAELSPAVAEAVRVAVAYEDASPLPSRSPTAKRLLDQFHKAVSKQRQAANFVQECKAKWETTQANLESVTQDIVRLRPLVKEPTDEELGAPCDFAQDVESIDIDQEGLDPQAKEELRKTRA